jgi:hypothetical protein
MGESSDLATLVFNQNSLFSLPISPPILAKGKNPTTIGLVEVNDEHF